MPTILYEGQVGQSGGKIVVEGNQPSELISAVAEANQKAISSRARKRFEAVDHEANGAIMTVVRRETGQDRSDRSVGDFIAHMLPIKSFEQICSIMSILIGADFKNEIKTIYLTLPVFKPLFGTIEDFFNEIIKQVVEMFNYRHIYCHELGIPDKVRYTSSGCVESTIKFLHLTEIFVEQITSKK